MYPSFHLKSKSLPLLGFLLPPAVLSWLRLRVLRFSFLARANELERRSIRSESEQASREQQQVAGGDPPPSVLFAAYVGFEWRSGEVERPRRRKDHPMASPLSWAVLRRGSLFVNAGLKRLRPRHYSRDVAVIGLGNSECP